MGRLVTTSIKFKLVSSTTIAAQTKWTLIIQSIGMLVGFRTIARYAKPAETKLQCFVTKLYYYEKLRTTIFIIQ